MPSPWAIAGGVWLLCSFIVTVLLIWDHIRRAPALPLRYELAMVAAGPFTLIFAFLLSREADD